ncbi:hypothetical protein L596_013559 [Steinernema carpocapsae]|uniref:Uncharacterized protein n=1 Tax=Steinernema carpocapsae TaxID=34508 RepID=A0A4U5P103_STECR|nr:hypothetical protein L596_013559 [Steinernema carpocapsae]
MKTTLVLVVALVAAWSMVEAAPQFPGMGLMNGGGFGGMPSFGGYRMGGGGFPMGGMGNFGGFNPMGFMGR